MAMVGLRVPPETARLLSGIEVEGKKEDIANFHITLLFMGGDIPIEQLAKALGAAHSVTSTTRPFSVSTSHVTCFPKGDDGVPIICPVDSDQLHDLHTKLCKAFDEAGVEYNKKYPEYKPHVTLSYADEAMEDRRIPQVMWGAHEVVVWGGDSREASIMMTFPLTLDTIAARVAARFQRSAFA